LPTPTLRCCGSALLGLIAMLGASSVALADADAPYDFSRPSALPFGLPPFDRLRDTDWTPGFHAAMAEQRALVDRIARDPAPASFDNTLVALERSGDSLQRVNAWFGEQVSTNTNDALDAVQTALAPELAAHQDAIFLDAALFRRVQAVYEARAGLHLDAEALRLVERYHTLFLRAGAALPEADKAALKAINQELATLATQFQQTLLKNVNDGAVRVDRLEDLAGASAETLAAAAQAAQEKGLQGKWLIALENTSRQPILGELQDRALRERIYRASIQRGVAGPGSTAGIVSRIVLLRARQARLLGYPNYAAYVLADAAAGTPEAVNRALHDLSVPAQANARRLAARLQALIDEQARAGHGARFELQPWDWDYTARQLRKRAFDVDDAEVKPYFELEAVLRDGVFHAAHELYGLGFRERSDLPVYRPGVRVFEVADAAGSPVGLALFDFFAHSNKQGGAWMSSYADQSELARRQPVVVVNLNIAEAPPGQPVLMTYTEVTTLFHEMGHALHGLLSRVRYPLLSGTNVALDFVEYPSQYNEMWATDPRVLAHYARHYRTGAPLPEAIAGKLQEMARFDEAFDTTEYLAAALLDQAWHQIGEQEAPAPQDVMRFEAAALERLGVDFAAVPPRYHSTYFAHIFSGGYAAGYYAYVWSAVLAADTKDWMRRHGGLERANGEFLRAKVLSRGNTDDASRLFERFYGAAPDTRPLLVERGLVAP
jgi:peptidyl-dipeptidase Dcp